MRYSVLAIFFLFIACETSVSEADLTPEDGEVYSGGETTVFRTDNKAFSQSVANLSFVGQSKFSEGNSIFNRNWVAAPNTNVFHDGVGPLFNSRDCETCHFRDGRGAPPQSFGEKMRSMLIRLSVPGTDAVGGPKPEPTYGGQLQEDGIFNVAPEGKTRISYEEISNTYPDGTPYTLRKPIYTFVELGYGPMSPDVLISPRVAPAMIGLGLLEAISEADILSAVDELDTDGDGISGRANYVWDAIHRKNTLGRFGWKANQPSMHQQVAGAFNGDMGLSTSVFPDQNDMPAQKLANKPVGYSKDDPKDEQFEVIDSRLEPVVFYSQRLAVPARRDVDNKTVLYGKKLFNQMNCSGCHTPSFVTGEMKNAPELSNQKIFPYTDLLLHDMGDGLADNRPDFLATGNEWRTPPLWGIGLIETVNNHTNFLHDGRARNIEEAILWHGGEAETSKNEFMKLSKADRDAVLKFLNSL